MDEEFFDAYVEAALWTFEGEEDRPVFNNEDGSRIISMINDIHPDTLATMRRDCEQFYAENRADLEARSASCGGHDFWLTRNGHGAGFWDGDWPKGAGDRLTEACKKFGEFDLYLGDDGMIYGERGYCAADISPRRVVPPPFVDPIRELQFEMLTWGAIAWAIGMVVLIGLVIYTAIQMT